MFAYMRQEPLGVFFPVFSYNSIVGNSMVFIWSPETPVTAVLLAEIYSQAGAPEGLFNVVQGGDRDRFSSVTASLKDMVPLKIIFIHSSSCHSKPRRLWLTLKHKIKIFLMRPERFLGALMANFLSQGLVCSNGTRVFVQSSILPQFLKEVVRRTKAIQIGDPLLDETRMGALVSKPHLDKVLGYVKQAKKEGARVFCGGEPFIPADPELKDGYYMTPCVLGELLAADVEIMKSLANDSALGLVAGVFTKDVKRARRFIKNLQTGSCFINNYNITPVEAPFGVYKASDGATVTKHFLEFYSQLKTVVVEMGDVDSLF
uniref:Aldehyde dehydrogenase 9 family, member A1b n=1 Tax=Cyprinus carpio TaxID=7962 RepID=A0A8C2CPQ3_CYPCA